MKKKWWEYFGYVGGACFIIGIQIFGFPSTFGVVFVVLGIITTATYFFMKQGDYTEDSH